ncbi:hypothetical protein SESBI_15624 [Sesbania bispinosa]|nr:hypothetical protein SESBI_15624 [Sesbania bispinosa]
MALLRNPNHQLRQRRRGRALAWPLKRAVWVCVRKNTKINQKSVWERDKETCN